MSKLLAGIQRYLQAAIVKSHRIFLAGNITETFDDLVKLVFPGGDVHKEDGLASARKNFQEIYFPILNTLVQVMQLTMENDFVLKSSHDIVVYAVDGNEPNTWSTALRDVA